MDAAIRPAAHHSPHSAAGLRHETGPSGDPDRRITAVAQREAELRAAGLTVRVVPGPRLVHADADRLHQALGNLLSNSARRFRRRVPHCL
ncbi:hypothetical protein ACIP2Y_37870 [Streptomyces sviceus]|uniref:hypothetical protein n=1 Tax=Streptomyces sviceus TaxID=285530 RepID=UPI00380914FF